MAHSNPFPTQRASTSLALTWRFCPSLFQHFFQLYASWISGITGRIVYIRWQTTEQLILIQCRKLLPSNNFRLTSLPRSLAFHPTIEARLEYIDWAQFLSFKGIQGQHYHVTWFLSSSHQTRWSCWTTTWSPTCPRFSSPSPSSATSPLGKIPSAGLRLWLQPQHVVQVLLQGDGELLYSAIFCLVLQKKHALITLMAKCGPFSRWDFSTFFCQFQLHMHPTCKSSERCVFCKS